VRPIRSRLVWGTEHYDWVVERVRNARASVWIATANLKDVHVRTARGRKRSYHSVLADFAQLSALGVDLRILHSTLPSKPFRDAFDGFPGLVAGGLQLRQCPRVHMKLVVVDGTWAYLGSANWTGAGLGVKSDTRRNFELGWWTADELVLDEVQMHFDRIWSGASCKGCQRRNVCEDPIDVIVKPRRVVRR